MAAGEFHPLATQLHPILQSQGRGHRLHGLGFAPHRIHQGELCLRQGNRHRQPREASASAHIDAAQRRLVLLMEQLPQRPEAVEHLGNPEVVALYQAGEVHAAVPAA